MLLPHRIHVDQCHEEIVAERARSVREDPVLRTALVRSEHPQTSYEHGHLDGGRRARSGPPSVGGSRSDREPPGVPSGLRGAGDRAPSARRRVRGSARRVSGSECRRAEGWHAAPAPRRSCGGRRVASVCRGHRARRRRCVGKTRCWGCPPATLHRAPRASGARRSTAAGRDRARRPGATGRPSVADRGGTPRAPFRRREDRARTGRRPGRSERGRVCTASATRAPRRPVRCRPARTERSSRDARPRSRARRSMGSSWSWSFRRHAEIVELPLRKKR